jgi:signal transduction histidine kinase
VQGWRIRKDGTKFFANVIISALHDANNNLVGFGEITRDLTQSKKTELLKNEFVSVVSHELRTPLTSIHGALSLILGGAAGEFSVKALQLLEIANTNCIRLVRLINDILDIEKIEAGKIDFDLKPIELSTLIFSALSNNQMVGEQHGVHISCDQIIPGIKVNADNDRLMQVLTNLISNAVKFSPDGETVKISMSQKGHRVIVAITDKGAGIPIEFQSKVFEKFSQADSTTTRQKGGTGLGLAISKALIHKLGGTLNFISKIGDGTTFFFDLPII